MEVYSCIHKIEKKNGWYRKKFQAFLTALKYSLLGLIIGIPLWVIVIIVSYLEGGK